ncbi:MAG TPA: peptide chain release factor N(5)-glutamine methyltransferase [Lacipirellulaceae bacterium]|nr:peptide chain release factor N(5)-glutamine methyltransferase [Lacipirellulaceae bacterium]
MPTSNEPWTIGRFLTWTADYLGRHGAENPRLDAEVLLAHARGCSRIDLYTSFSEEADDETRTAFRELVRRRAEGTPVAYLVGHREFYSLDFEVNPDVLIPRPETELLVVALLDHVKKRGAGGGGLGTESCAAAPQQELRPRDVTSPDLVQAPSSQSAAPLTIADVGTGSGILAICAAKCVPNAHVTAIDISPAALAVAKRNAKRHDVADRITFVESNLLSVEPAEPRFDYIVSNPPYVSTAELAQLARDVREHEPDVALRAGDKGTDVVAPLIEQSAPRLKPGGMLLIEVSPMIAAEVERLVREQPPFELCPTIRDLAGHPRVVQAIRTAKP